MNLKFYSSVRGCVGFLFFFYCFKIYGGICKVVIFVCRVLGVDSHRSIYTLRMFSVIFIWDVFNYYLLNFWTMSL